MIANALVPYDVKVEEVCHRLDTSLWHHRIYYGQQLQKIEVRPNGCWDAFCEPIDDTESEYQHEGEESEEEDKMQDQTLDMPDENPYVDSDEDKLLKDKRGEE